MSDYSSRSGTTIAQSKFFYGWVIVAVSTLMIFITYGIIYSYSVFFKPLASYFGWDRSAVSAIYSVFLFLRGAISIGTGWLADRHGPVKLMVFCGLMAGLGLILTSRVNALWQIYLTYGLIEAIGLSGSFTIGMAITSRWFTKKRGTALGIVSSGSGLGTLILVPAAERLISTFDWSTAFVILGIIAWLFMITTAFLLRVPTKEMLYQNDSAEKQSTTATDEDEVKTLSTGRPDMSLKTAVRSEKLWMLFLIFSLFVFCLQIIMVHLVNYATDIGISQLVAATFISTIGLVSIAGRVLIGIGSDKFGSNNALVFCCALLSISLIWLLFTRTLWGFYLFAIVFGFAYGGEIPLIPMFIGQFFGTRSMAALIGLLLFVSNIGGALGPWVGGKIFDMTMNYQLAFVITAIASLAALVAAFVLKKYSKTSD